MCCDSDGNKCKFVMCDLCFGNYITKDTKYKEDEKEIYTIKRNMEKLKENFNENPKNKYVKKLKSDNSDLIPFINHRTELIKQFRRNISDQDLFKIVKSSFPVCTFCPCSFSLI